jgi:hypothetical protein
METLFSDIDLQDPAEYYGGFKDARVARWGEAERSLSHPFTGEWSGSTFDYETADTDRAQRIALHNEPWRFKTPRCVRMVNRPHRAVLGTPWIVFIGHVVNAQPSGRLNFRYTLADRLSSTVISDQHQIPWRLIRDGFLDQLVEIAPTLDLDQPEPIIYGDHFRVPDIDPASPQGFEIVPPYLGTRMIDSELYHVWLIAGHAVADVPRIRLDLVETPEGSDWKIPHMAGHTALVGASYEDLLSSTFGVMRRYTLLYGVVGNAAPDAVALGDISLTVAVSGIEPEGDGTGTVISDRFLQYKHFAITYLARTGEDSYQSGPWLTAPEWADPFDGPRTMVHEASFDDCAAIGVERLPDNPGYIGAAVLGARAGDRAGAPKWVADWNRSCGCQFGVTQVGAMKVTLLHPTAAIKAAAPLYTDATEIALTSFGTDLRWVEHANLIPFRTDYEHLSGQYKTNDVAIHTASVTSYGTAIPSTIREYPFAPGITQANHLAVLESRIRQNPPRIIGLEAAVGPDENGDSLAYRELGDYMRYRHFASVGDTVGEIRLAQIVAHQVQVGPRVVRVAAMDCEDLIGFDEFEGGS